MGKNLIGQATPEQIAKWKKDCPDGVYMVQCEGHAFYFREPKRIDVNTALQHARETTDNPLAAEDKFQDLTYLDGSEEGKKIEMVWLGVGQVVREKMRGKEAVLVNL